MTSMGARRKLPLAWQWGDRCRLIGLGFRAWTEPEWWDGWGFGVQDWD